MNWYWSLCYNYCMILYIELIIKLDKKDKYKPILIVKDLMEQT